MRLSWNVARARPLFGAQALIIGAAVSVACSGDDDFTGGGAGSGGTAGRGGTVGNDGSAGNGGSAGSGGGSGAGGATGRGGSGGSAGSSGTSGSSAVDGGGSAGTGGAAGSSGGTAGSSGGTAGTAGSSGRAGGAGTGGATNCAFGDAGACPPGQYCNALGCESGTCMPLPAEGSTKNPVCGCDGLTYWNPSVAGHRGMSVSSMGECTQARTCGGIGTIECPGNAAFCNMKLMDSTMCLITDPAGTCWVLPSVCPSGPGIGPNTRACSAPTCRSECELIRAEQPWYQDNTCPT